MDVGKRIVRARKARKMTQAELAAALGKSVRMIQQYENGQAIPPDKIIPQLAAALGIKPGPLLGGLRYGATPGAGNRRGAI